MRSWPDLPMMRSLPLDRATIEAHDAAVVVTPHDLIDWKLVLDTASIVIDTRGIYREPRASVVKA